ncbi:MAG: hypothetical protein ACP5NV_05355 [Candidatus Woesearchaeota archaeon]
MSCKEFDICRSTVASYIVSGKDFTYDELMEEILKKGGVFRISNTLSLDDYMNHFVQIEIIKYSPAERTYFGSAFKKKDDYAKPA